MDPASPKTSHYAYAVVNTAVSPPLIVGYYLSRREGKEFVRWQTNADELRVRRARVTLFQS